MTKVMGTAAYVFSMMGQKYKGGIQQNMEDLKTMERTSLLVL